MTDRDSAARTKRSVAANPNTMSGAADAALESVAAPNRAIAPRKSRPGPAAPASVAPAAAAEREGVETATPPGAAFPVERRGITIETALYLAIMAAAILTRFWDLSAKALHHDESLHAYYSWVFETGGGYRHHPLMHGPFLFHANALVYFLFGDSDASSRYMPALFGVAAVGLPYLLRSPHLLGRWGALAASFLILISPVLLYQSRYIRHDIYTVTGTLLLFVSIVRYWERPQRRWLVIGAASTSFLLTNHEIVFAILVIFGGYLYGALAVSRIRAWWPERRKTVLALAGLHVALLAAFLVLIALASPEYTERLFDIPWDNPTTDQQMDYYSRLLENRLVLGAIVILGAFAIGFYSLLDSVRDPERRADGWLPSLFGDPPPRTLEAGLRSAWADRTGLTIALVVAVSIFVFFFTSMFTNLYGLVSSTFATDGTILYWLGQHDVRRGEQPWFYFLVLLPQYEFIALIFGSMMALLTGARAIRGVFDPGRRGRNLFFRAFLTVWLAGIFLGLSYAGEKMPWLLSHIALPLSLLAAASIGGLIERAVEARRPRQLEEREVPNALGWPEWSLGFVLLAAVGAWLVLASRLSVGRFVEADHAGGWSRTLTSYSADRWWWLAIPPLVAAAAIIASSLARGSRRSGLATLGSLLIALTLLQSSVAWRLSYEEPDVPKEMLIYTQTSPDITRVVDELTQLSFELTGGYGLEIWYDSGVSWPMQWYLREFPNKHFFGSSISGPPGDAPVLLVASDRNAAIEPHMAGYTVQEYVLRWWFPEELYREFAIAPELDPGRSAWSSANDPHGPANIAGSVIDSVVDNLTPEGQARLFRMFLFRDLEQPLGHYRFKVYVRNDLLPLLNSIRY